MTQTAVASHQRGKSRSSANANRHVKLTCRLGAALAGGSSMAIIFWYSSEVQSVPVTSYSRGLVCVGQAAKIASDSTTVTRPRSTYQRNVDGRRAPMTIGPIRYGIR